METFPPYVKVVFDGFAIERESAAARYEMENGPDKQLRRRSRVLIALEVTCHVDSQADLAAFVQWVYSVGADWFSWTDPVDGVAKPARIRATESFAERARTRTLSHWEIRMHIETWSN
jgi:hypothetical protein